MISLKHGVWAMAAAAMLLSAVPANAVPVEITVPNFSFESPTNTGIGGSGAPTDWTRTGTCCGVFTPNSLIYSGGVPNGTQAAYINGNGSLTSGDLGDFQVGTYVLTFYAGRRNDLPFATGVTAALLADGVAKQTLSVSATPPAQNTFALYTLTLVIGALDPDLGDDIAIRFAATGGNQVNFDWVRLTYDDGAPSGVPLPASVWLFGSALAGAAGFRTWRRRRKAA